MAQTTAARRPATAKKPADHQPKKVKPKVENIEITLGDGDSARTVPARRTTIRDIEVTVPEEAIDDFELLDDLRAAQDKKDASRFPSLMRRLTGDDGYRAAMEGLRGPNGRVSIEDGVGFVNELLEALDPS